MLIENKLKDGDIMAAKLITGEEIVAKVVKIDDHNVQITKPLMITLISGPGMSQPAVAPVPWILAVPDDAVLTLSRDRFLFLTRARNEIISSYTRATTGLEIPPAGLNIGGLR
jgi:hypothetical protein